jgi:hypothetical protein
LIPVFGIGRNKSAVRSEKVSQIRNTSIWMPGSGRRAQARNNECSMLYFE